MARRSVLDELWAARNLAWKQDDLWRAADDAVWQILQRPHSQHEYLTAQLEVAHAHMVGRDVAEQAVVAMMDAPRPQKRDAEEARRLLGEILDIYGSHRGALERTVAWVRDRKEEEAARRARRAATPADRVPPPVATVHTARSSGRSLV
jgi:hypothetical protein